jgi:hypothetical protein
MLRTTNAAGRIRDESLMNLGGRANNTFDLVVIGHWYCWLRQNKNSEVPFLVNNFVVMKI